MTREESPYTKELLEEILSEGSATLLSQYTKFNQRLRIEFLCKCGDKVSKRFEMLKVHRMPYCKGCSVIEHEKRKVKTCLAKHGVVNVFCIDVNKQKMLKTWADKYGDHPKRTKEVQDKWRQTCLEKYGGHPNQNKGVQEKSEKSSYRFKEYRLPSGKVIKYQGYENLALDELFEKGYTEDDIIIGRAVVPIIEYYIDESKHVYFPDIYIKSINKIIEIKSDWTIQLKRNYLVEKADATVSKGYLFEVWIYDSNKKKVNEILWNDLIG